MAAAEISETPLKGNNPTFEFVLEGVTRGLSDPPVQAGLRAISAGCLHVAGIPVLSGREFGKSDSTESVPVAIVNQRWLAAIGRTGVRSDAKCASKRSNAGWWWSVSPQTSNTWE